MNAFDREMDLLDQQLENGEISEKEHRQYVRDLQRGLEDEAREAAREAYDRKMGY